MKWGDNEKKEKGEIIVLPDSTAVIIFPYWQGKIFDPDFLFWKKIINLYPNELFLIPHTVKIPSVFQGSFKAAILPSTTTKRFLLQIRRIVPNLQQAVLVGADI